MKFTEEQYRAIVEAWDAKNTYSESTKAVTEMVVRDFNESWKYDIGQVLALGNETSREWAYEQFVEKEKKYVWTSQKSDDKGEKIRLHKTPTNAIKGSLSTGKERVLHDEELTESEVKEWGYDPDKFDKEEVVVTEKKYVWTSKKGDKEGQHIRLCLSSWYAVSTSFVEQGETFSESEKLTESEIREWGYNPEMFDKEEVE